MRAGGEGRERGQSRRTLRTTEFDSLRTDVCVCVCARVCLSDWPLQNICTPIGNCLSELCCTLLYNLHICLPSHTSSCVWMWPFGYNIRNLGLWRMSWWSLFRAGGKKMCSMFDDVPTRNNCLAMVGIHLKSSYFCQQNYLTRARPNIEFV